MTLSVCVAGATGWTGRAVAEAILEADDLELRSAVSRSAAGDDLGKAWSGEPNGVPVFERVSEALDGIQVVLDYTSHQAVRGNTLAAIERGVSVVIGSSGLSADDFFDIDAAARNAGVGVVAAGNFSLTAAMAQAAALLVARHLPNREIIDYASAGKRDAPSGTARELAERLAAVNATAMQVRIDQTGGIAEARGATVSGTQVHSVRLPGFEVSTEVVFALPDERLSIRHDAGATPTPYVGGTLLAIRAAVDAPGWSAASTRCCSTTSSTPVEQRGCAMDMVDVDGLQIWYERAGDGPPLVLLHGYVGDGPTTWRRQIDELRDEFTVVAWNAPGVGRSSDPPESFGLAGYADCLAGFVRCLGLADPHVAGLSFGGALALELYRRHPAVPRTLILASAYAGWAGSLPADVAEQRLRQSLVVADLSPEEFVATLLPTMFSEATPADTVDRFGTSMLGFHPAGFRAMAYASAENVRDVLPDITVPTLLVYGDKDLRAPLSVAEDLHAAISGSTLVVLPGAGHLCTIETPDGFNGAVRTFLRDRRH